jgi:RND family efflux transporter MFP subunit
VESQPCGLTFSTIQIVNTRLIQDVLLLLLVAALTVSSGCNASSPSAIAAGSEAPTNVIARSVKTARVRSFPFETVVIASGSLAAFDRSVLSTKVAGRLEALSVDLGSEVQAGDLLAQIAPEDYKLRLRQSQAQLAQARARLGLPLEGNPGELNLEQTSTVRRAQALLEEARAGRERIVALAGQGIVPQSELDAAEAALSVALSRYTDAMEEIRDRMAILAQRQSELEIAEKQLRDTSITAPFPGIIEIRHANLGEFLSATTPIVTLVRMNPLRLRLEIPERDAPDIQPGQIVRIKVDGHSESHIGKITRLSPVIDQRSRVLRVEADVSNPGTLRPGSFVRAEIVVDSERQAITVPPNALVTFAGIEKVYVIQAGKAVERLVNTGRIQGTPGLVEIRTGLNADEVVILDPGDLKSGAAVRSDADGSSS